MKKTIDDTAGRVGAMLRQARRVCHMPQDDAAALLHIMPDKLAEYERGFTKIPSALLERMFVLGYKMMHVRVLENRYRQQNIAFRRLQRTVEAAAANKAE